MRTNFEKFTKRDSVVNEQGEQWQERRDRIKKRHKQQRGNSQKREWN